MANDTAQDLFGKVQMGYALIESERINDWQRFAEKGLGLHLDTANADLLAFRMDSHRRRLVIQRGPAEDFTALGLQLRDAESLRLLLARLAERDIDVTRGSAEEAALRGVKDFWRLIGPKGLPIEVFTSAETTDEPLWMLSSGFITGESGMGHVAITSRQPEKMQRFWQELFDARVSDRIREQIAGVTLEVTFLRFNERHHSVAVAATRGLRMDPIRTQVQHMNILVTSLDELGTTYRRLRDLGFEMAHEIGQHPNDKEVSFYVNTPSGFEIEVGWNALTVDEATWQVQDYTAISTWGHKPQKASLHDFLRVNAGNLRNGLRSLLRPEYSPL